jgi:hypothetical protein
MSGLVIDQRETALVRQDILGAVVTVTQRFLQGEHALDDGLHQESHFRTAFLDPAIKRLDPKLHEHRMIAKRLNLPGIARRGLVNHSENAANLSADFEVYLPLKQRLFPHFCLVGRMTHGEDVVIAVTEEDFRHG